MPRLWPQGLETHGKGSNGIAPGQGAGAWKPKEPPAQVSPCWCPWQVGHGRCTPADVPQLVCPHRCAPAHGPQQVCPDRCALTEFPPEERAEPAAGPVGRVAEPPGLPVPTPSPEARALPPLPLPHRQPGHPRELTLTPPGPPRPSSGAHKGRGGKRKIAEICLVWG